MSKRVKEVIDDLIFLIENKSHFYTVDSIEERSFIIKRLDEEYFEITVRKKAGNE